ncbi:MAG TPA: surface lipoprotein assembly modifier [Candidatus Paceibacterota bacterium]|nr:surface lipoprotein assembly modifier [Candidatus Paceibacterota bacterium]
MKSRSDAVIELFVRFVSIAGCWWCVFAARAQSYLTPDDVALRGERASEETLKQSAGKTSLRALGLDVFPRATVTAFYDDNLLITATNRLSDVEWTLSPGLTLAAGDVSLYLPGSVRLSQIRNLLNYSLLDDDARPQRYVGFDYSPSVNLFARHDRFNNVDHTVGLSAGYTFSRLITGLDVDYTRIAVKDSGIGDRVTREMTAAKWRNRYEWTDRSAIAMNCEYSRLRYVNGTYQGYDEFRNEDWFDRKMGARLEVGLGGAFGFVYPERSPDQTYQQAFVRGLYRLTGKLNVRARVGAEWREYGGGSEDTLDPSFDLAAIYQPQHSTTFTLAGHQRTAPSFGVDYNYQIFGVTAGVAQQLTGALDGELIVNYEHIDYVQLTAGADEDRKDDYIALQARLGYEFNTHLKAMLFYNWTEDASNLTRYSYDNNVGGLQISWRY